MSAGGLAITLAGCSSGGSVGSGAEEKDAPQSIEIVSDPESTGKPIDLDRPLHDSGMFEPEKWPSACELTDEATISGILPQVDQLSVGTQDRDVSLLSMGFGGGEDEGEDEVTIPDAECATGVGFPEEMGIGQGDVTFAFRSTIDSAGSEEFVSRNAGSHGGQKETIGDATCWRPPNGLEYQCTLENIAFTISLDARPYGQYLHEAESRYTVDGEDVTIGSDMDAFQTMVDQEVLRPTVEAAIDRLG
ncbi:hypothetical protein [Brachybacterium sp. ACRRE]|uniref:hypothetical protein n=1 Tax=Brachybacterium sp. ACRRE TaxID=2918184 RepID=UPI001EF28C32|nr:hypothetical protein [Brachybacterium sp. ACRRE]MCG7310173.1 hypothetical protein [Brachybacterium sp. ACRRE]